jgi:chemotaxis protein histidine kinase CheA
MSDLQLIEQTLMAAATRRRRDRAVRGLWRGMFIGAIIVFLTVAAYKLLPLPLWSIRAAVVAGVVSAIVGMIIGGWRRDSLNQIARWVDGRQHLQERLSTALELSKTPGPESWRELLVTDAAAHLKDFDLRRVVRFSFTRAFRWAFLLVALTVGLGFAPVFRTKAYVQKQADQNVIKDAGKHLVELTKQSLSNRPPALESTQKALDAVNDLGDQLSKKSMTRTEALKDLTKVSDRLKEEMQNLNSDPALKRMQQAAHEQSESSSDSSQMQKQLEEAQKQMGNSTATPQDIDKLNQELNKLQEAAKAEQEKNGELSQATKDKMSQSLAALAKQSQDMGLNMPNLDQAIQALAASQTGMFLKDMQASVDDLQKMSDLAKSVQQMEAQMQKAGKDLAEQLKNGQPEAAQATLQKMIDQLKSANLTPEQLKQIMSDVSKAVDPGSKYGKVADFLTKAGEQMQAGQKPDAAQSLADASKELDRLMQQMGDAKSLMAEMNALNQASMCIGTCNSWGQCQGKASYNPHGKKIGKGVGTWADENGGWGYDGQQTELTDNSTMKRPDMAGKGLTDRGEGELSDALKPTQLKGQFSPGGQMPSITLKGVSIKGTSTVTLEEATVAAQQDAQSALSQEKVPRAYQGAVRDYFDDLKK